MEELFKACKKCGTICTKEVESCPASARGLLGICGSSDFRPLTAKELRDTKNGKIRFWYKKWPDIIRPVRKE